MVRRLTLFICLFGSWSLATAASLEASVDRKQLSKDEHLIFTLSLINSDTRLRAEGINPNVDLTLLSKDFTLSRPTADNRYNIYQGRGRSTSSITVTLFPRRSGRLKIPSFEIDGLRSQAITIDVKQSTGNSANEIFVRSGANKNSLWAGEQLVVYLDLYHRVSLDRASLGDNLETEPTRIELLPHWKLDQETRKERFRGYDYEVERIAWAIFPTGFPTGTEPLTVQLPDVWTTSEDGRKQRLPHQRLEFKVKPLPAGIPADIIIGKPELRQTLLPHQAKQHELTHWTVSLKAPVAVTSLPKFLPGVELPEGLKLYPDPARRDTAKHNSGIIDQANYTLSLMPVEAGEFQTPVIRVPYFDPDTGKADYVELPGQTLNVIPAPLPEAKSDLDLAGSELFNPQNVASPLSATWFWPITTALFALLWLITLGLWLRVKNARPQQQEAPRTATRAVAKDQHPLQHQLLTALNSTTLEQGLEKWLRQQPEDTTVLNAVRAVQRLCYGRTTEQTEDTERQVQDAIKLIRQQPVQKTSNEFDEWRPEAFTPGQKM